MKRLKNIVSPVYDKYLEIPVNDHQQKIRYFERHFRELQKLPDEVYQYLFIDYTSSLYKVREFRQFLRVVDEALELIIIENIESFTEDDLYESFLYMKASALYYGLNHKQANYVLMELIHIQGVDKKTRNLFMRNSIEELRYNDQYIRSMIILLIIFSGIIIGVELLLVRSFYPEYTKGVEQCRNVLLMSGILVFLFQELRIRFISMRKYKKIQEKKQ